MATTRPSTAARLAASAAAVPSHPRTERPYAADPLAVRIDALGELLGLSRTRISPDALAESSELLARMGERRRLSPHHTVVALAGATGSGKSSLFNALTGRDLSRTGVRRPTTARPVACVWGPEQAAGLMDRLDIAPQDRHSGRHLPEAAGSWVGDPGSASRGAAHCSVGDGAEAGGSLGDAKEQSLDGLVLVDLPDHDSAATEHREQVDRLLRLVDVVVWVLDPEKYADAALHERYLRPLAGHADVTVLVLNQVDRLSGDSAELVLDDLRRLLDEDGLAVGEHGEAGAIVLASSALTGQGVSDLRAVLAQLSAERAASGRRLAADMDRAASSLHPLYVGEGGAGLTDPAREEFIDRLGDAVGASGAGQSAERDWGRAAREACGTPWGRLLAERTASGRRSRFGRKARSSHVRVMLRRRRRPSAFGPVVAGWASRGGAGGAGRPGGADGAGRAGGAAGGSRARRPRPAGAGDASRSAVAEAVRGLAADASRGLPEPWAQAVREAARRGGEDLPEALDAAVGRARPGRPERPGWWSAAASVQWLLMALGLAGAICLTAVLAGWLGWAWWLPPGMIAAGGLGGPLVTAVCRFAARGPARRYGQAAERRLRDAAADCGRARVLEPVAAEVMRYREVREQYAVVAGAAPGPRHSHE